MIQDLALISPMAILAIFGLLVLLIGVFIPKGEDKSWLGYLTIVGFTASLLAVWWLWQQQPSEFSNLAFGYSVIVDGYGLAMAAIILIGAILTTLSAIHYMPDQGADHPEYHAIVAFSTLGMLAMVFARDLLTMFVAIETMSLGVYVLAGFKRQSAFSTEAALKYFVLGSFASCLLLMGIAFVYGATGTISLPDIAAILSDRPPEHTEIFARIGMVMLIAAFAFKIGAAPFHMWTPDVYEGAPASVTGFMAVAVKAAAFAAMARVIVTCFGSETFRFGAVSWESLIIALAIASMFIGNLGALFQRNLKRVLAYSAIAHTGYILIAFVATPPVADEAGRIGALGGGLVFYLLAYTLANAGAFGVAAAISGGGKEDLDEKAYAGLARRHAGLGFVLTVSILSLLGIPATAGFIGKLTIFSEALETPGSDHLWLIVVAVVNSIISAWYYLRILVVAFMHEPEPGEEPVIIESRANTWALALAGGFTLLLGLLPNQTLESSKAAGESLMNPPALNVDGAPELGSSEATDRSDEPSIAIKD